MFYSMWTLPLYLNPMRIRWENTTKHTHSPISAKIKSCYHRFSGEWVLQALSQSATCLSIKLFITKYFAKGFSLFGLNVCGGLFVCVNGRWAALCTPLLTAPASVLHLSERHFLCNPQFCFFLKFEPFISISDTPPFSAFFIELFSSLGAFIIICDSWFTLWKGSFISL